MNLLSGLEMLLGKKKQPQGMNINLRGRPEDASFIPGQQGHVRQNADVAHFRAQPTGRPEDAGLVRGPQGYGPMNADVANFHVPNFQTGGYNPQDPGQETIINPQRYKGLGWQPNLQDDPLRRLLGL